MAPTGGREGAFTRRGTGALAAVGIASLAAAGFLGVYGDVLYDPPSFAPDSFSRSAVGHRALVEVLRGLGRQVIVSRHRTAERAAEDVIVLLLEPRVGPDDATREAILEEVNGEAMRLLVVLPKRRAIPDPTKPRWVADASLLPVEDAARVVDALGLEGAAVVRPDRTIAGWEREAGLPAPSLDRPQLVASEELSPLVATAEGMLAGEVGDDDWRTIVLADPDVLATHGLGRGENAALVVRLLERLGPPDLPIVVDETLHGLDQRPSLARELLRLPLLLATLSALLAGALLAWAALVRFGRPRPPEPALASGKLFLVESTAGLLRHGGNAGHAAEAYLRAAKDEVVHRLRPPGEAAQPDAWLARHAAARGAEGALRALEERVARLGRRRKGGEEEAVRTAQEIHRLREELTDGADRDAHTTRPDRDPRADRAAQG
jgi:hypothetical protein